MKVSANAEENCPLREFKSTAFLWEFKRGVVKASECRTVRLQECTLGGPPLYTILQRDTLCTLLPVTILLTRAASPLQHRNSQPQGGVTPYDVI